MLTIELVPKSCFFSNLRNAVAKSEWDRIRHNAYAEAAHKCSVCGGRGQGAWPLEAHETWEYDDINRVQKLVDVVALCPACHEVKHFGRTQLIGREAEALAHLAIVNHWTVEQAQESVNLAFEVWERRSQETWKQDLTWATGKVTKWKDEATKRAAINAGFQEIEKCKRDLKVAQELMED